MKIRSLESDVNPHAVGMNLREQSLKRLLILTSGRLLIGVQKTSDTWFLDSKVKMMLYVGLSVRPIQSRHYTVWETSREKVCLANSSLSFLSNVSTPLLSTKNSSYLFLAVRPLLLGCCLFFVFGCQAPKSDLCSLVCFGILLHRQCFLLCLQKNCICTPLYVCARTVYQILSIQFPPCALILSFVGLTVNFPLENAFCEVQIDEMYCLTSV